LRPDQILVTDRLSDITARIEGVRQLGAVVGAMRGIAAARAQQARNQLAAVDSYAQTIALAIGKALDFLPRAVVAPKGPAIRPALVVFCAEQGFAGAFSERVLTSVEDDLGKVELFLVGTRGQTAIAQRGIVAGWTSAMPSHSAGVPRLADRIVEALYTRLASGAIGALDVVFSRWRPREGADIVRQRLFPFDLSVFPSVIGAKPPLLNLAPDVLVRALAADYMHAQLCRAGLHAFAAENQARMEAMAAARKQVQRELGQLQARQRRVRQEEITAEVIELAAGESASQVAPRG
jgi:F-type H+-transporting ATPase subunit gamma